MNLIVFLMNFSFFDVFFSIMGYKIPCLLPFLCSLQIVYTRKWKINICGRNSGGFYLMLRTIFRIMPWFKEKSYLTCYKNHRWRLKTAFCTHLKITDRYQERSYAITLWYSGYIWRNAGRYHWVMRNNTKFTKF